MAYEETVETDARVKTLFDEDGFPMATNHAGWDVQKNSPPGWIAINAEPIPNKHDAKVMLDRCRTAWPDQEYRVYEAVRRVSA